MDGRTIVTKVHMYSGNLMPEFPHTAHSCSQHGPATVWLKSERPENVIRTPETFTVVGA